MYSGRKNNYSAINNYNTAPMKKVINTKSPLKKSKQGSLIESQKSIKNTKFSATQKVSVNLGQIVSNKKNLKSDKKFIKTSKVDLITPTSSRTKKIDLTKKIP